MNAEYFALIFLQCGKQNHTKYTAGDYFSGTYGKTIIPKALQSTHPLNQQPVSIDQNQGDNDHIGDNRTYWRTPLPSAQGKGADSADQRCQTAKYNIRQGATCQYVAEQTADKETRYRSRGKERQDGERF